jgi:hypothetical protein
MQTAPADEIVTEMRDWVRGSRASTSRRQAQPFEEEAPPGPAQGFRDVIPLCRILAQVVEFDVVIFRSIRGSFQSPGRAALTGVVVV